MFSKFQKLFILIWVLILVPFMVGAETWTDPTCDPPACNTDGPVWSSPTVSQDAYADLDYSNEDDTPIFTITDSRLTGATNGSLYVSSLVDGKPALKISSTGSTASSYAAAFSAASAPSLYLTGGISFAGRGTDLTYTPEGLLYYNTASHLFKFYNGTTWVELNNQWTTNGNEIYRSFAASATGQGIGIKSGDATDPNDDYNLDIYRKALGTDDAAAYARLEDSATTDYASASMGAYATTSNYLTGVSAKSTADDGIGVYGIAEATGAVINYGGHFTAAGDGGTGVYGEGRYGGEFVSEDGMAVYGRATGTGAGDNYGGFFVAEKDGGMGVWAEANGSGVTTGGYFVSEGGSGSKGVMAHARETGAVINYGLWARAQGDTGQAVYGLADATGNITNHGGYFVAAGDTGEGIYAEASSTASTINYGGHFVAASEAGRGIFAESTATIGSGPSYGAYITAVSPNGYGVYTSSTGTGGIGIKAEALSTGTGTTYGGYFQANSGGSRAIYAEAGLSGAYTNYGGYFVARGNTGYGISATATATGAVTNYGGAFSAAGDSGRAVYGNASSTDTSNIHYGGFFTAPSGDGIGVYATGNQAAAHFGGDVGINTSTPDYDLDIVGDMLVDDGSGSYGVYVGSSATAPTVQSLYLLEDGSNGLIRNYLDSGTLTLQAGSTTASNLHNRIVLSGGSGTDDIKFYNGSGEIASVTSSGIESARYYGSTGTTYYLDPDNSVTSAYVAGDMSLGRYSGTDDDYLYFDQNVEYLRWENTNSRFYMSDDLYVYYDLSTGSDVMAAAAVYIDSNFNGTYDYLYFGDSSATSNYLRFEDANDRFYLNDDLYVLGVVSQSSDRRLKKNIKGIDSALDIVNSLEPVSFDWKEDNKGSYGFIAQDMYEVLPELVHKPIDENLEGDYWGVDYSKMTSVLTAAMQEQQVQIEEQGKEIDELKKQIEYLMENIK